MRASVIEDGFNADERLLYRDSSGMVSRALGILLLPLRTLAARARGRVPEALYPAIDAPAFRFPVQSVAARYAQTHLFPPSAEALTPLVYRILAKWMGCDPRVAGVTQGATRSEGHETFARIEELCRARGEDGVPTCSLTMCTTRPVHLLFDTNESVPLWVVRFGREAELTRDLEITSSLRAAAPDLVARPLLCARWNSEQWIYVQGGIGGEPWFRWASRLREPGESLANRIVQILHRFHAAVRASGRWFGELELNGSITREWRRCETSGAPFSPRLRTFVNEMTDPLNTIRFRWFAQHGDYAPNNVLLRNDEGTVIDFEEFGLTIAPLHDEIGLALAINDFTEYPPGSERFAGLMRICVQPTLDSAPELRPQLRSLVLHHLLNRLGNCLERPSRQPMIPTLLSRLESFAENPDAWLAQVS